MPNPFDQFDAQGSANPFDQFDSAGGVGGAPVQFPDITQTQSAGAVPSVAEDTSTRATREIPELYESGLLAGKPFETKDIGVVGSLMTLSDPEEMAQVITSNYPQVGKQYDEKGNIFVTNNDNGARAMLNAPGATGQDLIQFLGLSALYSPAGRAASIPGAMVKGALTETGIQAGQKASGGQFNTGEVVAAGVIPGAPKAVEQAISGGYRLAKGSVPAEAQQVLEAGRSAGVPVMTTDIIPPKTLPGKLARSVGEKIPVIGTSPIRATQQDMRQEAVQGFIDKYQTPSYVDIVQSMKDQKSKVMNAAGNVLETSGKKLDDIGDIPVNDALTSIDEALLVLSKPNVKADPTAVEELQTLRDLLSMPQTFSTLKENRTILNDTIESFGKGDRSQLPTRSKSLLKKAAYGMKQDMDSFAKANLTPREYQSWNKANAVWGEQAEKLRKSKIKNILDKGDITPEQVNTMLLSKNPSEVKMLFESLTTKGRENARAALIYKAYDNASKRSGGVTPNVFATELGKLTKNTDVFFRGKEKRQLEGFKRLLDATRRAQDAAVETPTGQQLLGGVAVGAAFTDLGATLGLGGTAAGLARLYESAPVRNALLRLGSIDRRSDRFLNVLFEAQSAITVAAQSLKDDKEAIEESLRK